MRILVALEQWWLALETEGRRPATITTYRWHWTPLLRWLDAQALTDLDQLTPFVIRRWLAEYQKTHSPASLKTTHRIVPSSASMKCRWSRRKCGQHYP